MKKVSVPCVHCGAPGGRPLWTGREHEYDNTTRDDFTFVRCESCGLVRLDPRPDVSELGTIYPANYYAYNLVSEEPATNPSATDRAKMRMYQRRLLSLLERLGKTGRVRILDVGCADGRLLDWYAASSAGDRLETHGIEMNEEAAAIARRRGHRVVAGRFELDDALEAGAYPILTASDCSICVGTLPALARRRPDAHVLWLDAHGDFNSPDTSGSAFLGGMALAGACGMWDP
ncbi:MAG TPA: arginase family protein, partial [Thermoleophilaceae bacterium]|nr:arginase family protein [Thermoleophilaceae bacterium]